MPELHWTDDDVGDTWSLFDLELDYLQEMKRNMATNVCESSHLSAPESHFREQPATSDSILWKTGNNQFQLHTKIESCVRAMWISKFLWAALRGSIDVAVAFSAQNKMLREHNFVLLEYVTSDKFMVVFSRL